MKEIYLVINNTWCDDDERAIDIVGVFSTPEKALRVKELHRCDEVKVMLVDAQDAHDPGDERLLYRVSQSIDDRDFYARIIDIKHLGNWNQWTYAPHAAFIDVLAHNADEAIQLAKQIPKSEKVAARDLMRFL